MADKHIQDKANVFKGMSIAVQSQRVKISIPGVPGSEITNCRFPGKDFTFPDFPTNFPGTKTIPEIPGNVASIPGIPGIPGAPYHPPRRLSLDSNTRLPSGSLSLVPHTIPYQYDLPSFF